MTAETIAQGLLLKLLNAGNRSAAGMRRRKPALTAAQIKPYSTLRNWHQKQECEEVFLAARDAGAISLTRDKLNPTDGLIERIDLIDTQILAGFLKQTTHAEIVAAAESLLAPYKAQHDVLDEIIAKWARMATVRGWGPRDAADWVDAIKIIDLCTNSKRTTLSPLRESSARLLKDSKRIERLTVPLDVLLMGSLVATPRVPAEVWQELGLFKEEQPVLLAGYVQIVRERVTALLDQPYTGLPASTIRALSGPVNAVLTIENLTTFHSAAKRDSDQSRLLIYTGGMPSPGWRQMYQRLLSSLPPNTPISHWGDVDEGGFRIAATLANAAAEIGRSVEPHHMSPDDVPEDLRSPASQRTLLRMKHFADIAGWSDLSVSVFEAGFTVEQEAL